MPLKLNAKSDATTTYFIERRGCDRVIAPIYHTRPRRDGLVVSVSASHAVGRGFASWSGHSWLCFTSHPQRGHLATAPPLTVPAKDVKVFTPFPPGIEPRAVAWQSITLPLHHAISTRVIAKTIL